MGMIDTHKLAIESISPVYHEFLATYDKTEKSVYAFVEGRDDIAFYRGFIEQTIPDDWTVKLWCAGNKDKVIHLHSNIDWKRFPKTRIVFFVDRDLADFTKEMLPKDDNVYVTDGYSIENYIVTRPTCERVLIEVCNLSELSNDEKEKILDLFDEQLIRFKESLIPVMAWIIHWKRSGQKPCLDDIVMKHLFNVVDGKLQIKKKPKNFSSIEKYIHKQCNISYKPNEKVSTVISEFVRADGLKRFIRGKYILWFLVEFSLSIHKAISKYSSRFSKPPKMHISFSHSNGMLLLATRTRIPKSLRKFLECTFRVYIEEVTSAA